MGMWSLVHGATRCQRGDSVVPSECVHFHRRRKADEDERQEQAQAGVQKGDMFPSIPE